MLLFFTLIIAICWIFYELMIWTLSSYLIGDSIRQFSFTIGFFMSGMWIWAYLSRFLEDKALKNFLNVELFLSVIWASSVILLKVAYIFFWFNQFWFQIIYFFLTMFIWSLVWIEIPLVATIFKKLKIKTKSVISDIFTFDYIWALISSLLFPIILLPYFWLYYSAILVWFLNLLVWFLYIWYLKKYISKNNLWKKDLKKIGLDLNFIKYYIIVFMIIWYFIFLVLVWNKLENFFLKFYYKEPILISTQTDYQNIVLTKRWEDFRMYINWNIQFMSLDENRYHEALVDWSMKALVLDHSLAPSLLRKGESKSFRVLVLWWWDGLVVRNLLKYDNISDITIVELDPEMIELSKTNEDLLALNKESLSNDKVKVIVWDAEKFIRKTEEKYDFIIADFPDPRDVFTSKLYTKEFYIWVYGTLNEKWVFVTQASNAFFATRAFYSIEKTIKSVFWNSLPYHRYLPSFWDWWFVLAQKNPEKLVRNICGKLWCEEFDDWYDVDYDDIEENTLDDPVIIEYYIEWYKKFNL